MLNLTKTILFTSTPKVSKNIKISKQSVETLKKACSENVRKSKHSHVEKPDIINTLKISEERDNGNTLLATSNSHGDHQPPLSKQKQFTPPEKTLATNPSFEHSVGNVVSKVVVECGKKFYFNDSSEYKVSTADVTSMNIFKFSCASPRLNKYSNIRNNKNQVLPQKRLDHSVGLQQLSRFGISNQTANALLLKMINSRKKFHKQCSSFKSTKDLKT